MNWIDLVNLIYDKDMWHTHVNTICEPSGSIYCKVFLDYFRSS